MVNPVTKPPPSFSRTQAFRLHPDVKLKLLCLIVDVEDEEEVPPESGTESQEKDNKEEADKEKKEESEKNEENEEKTQKTEEEEAGSKTEAKVRAEWP